MLGWDVRTVASGAFVLPSTYAGHNYVGHNYAGHNYTGHNFLDHNYIVAVSCSDRRCRVAAQGCTTTRRTTIKAIHI